MDGEKAELLFKNDVIEVSVVNYGYQLISKVDHMSNAVSSGRGTKKKDWLDAAFCLHELTYLT